MKRQNSVVGRSERRQRNTLAWVVLGALVAAVFAVGIGFLCAYYYVFDVGGFIDEWEVAKSDTMAKMKLRFVLGAVAGAALGVRFMVRIYRSDYGAS